MKKENLTNKKKIGLSVILLTLLFGIFFAVFYMVAQSNLEQAITYPFGMSSYQDTGDYTIDPETILLSIEKGETNVFYPVSAPSQSGDNTNLPTSPYPYLWTQANYLKVASVLHEFVWNENLQGWHLYSLYFFRKCQDNPVGFDSGELTLSPVVFFPIQQEFWIYIQLTRA